MIPIQQQLLLVILNPLAFGKFVAVQHLGQFPLVNITVGSSLCSLPLLALELESRIQIKFGFTVDY